jgi:hypothetical protein
MESTPPRPTALEAAAALRDAEASRATLTERIALPSWFFASIGAAIAVQIATAAIGLGAEALWLPPAGAAVFGAVAGVQLVRFRRTNGIWVGGFASRVVFGTGGFASASYAVALGAAIWAGYEASWWLAAVWSLAGGAAYALSGRRWLRAYRAQPAEHWRGESAAWLALIGAGALTGLALLLLSA